MVLASPTPVNMRRSISLIFALALASTAFADFDRMFSATGLRKRSLELPKRFIPGLLGPRQDTCQGSCASCFGAQYINCPGDSIDCYDPTTQDGSTACSNDSGGSDTDTCVQQGGTCVSCFGAGYTNCPSGSYYTCYNPADYSQTDGCNQPGTNSSSGGTNNNNNCETQYGSGSVPCGSDSCYNPTDGEVCCSDGRS